MKLNKQQHKLAAAVRSGALVGAVAVGMDMFEIAFLGHGIA